MFRKKLISTIIFSALASTSFAVTTTNLKGQDVNYLANLLSAAKENNSISLKELNRGKDFNQTLHIRFQEMYRAKGKDYSVYGGYAGLHVPKEDLIKVGEDLSNLKLAKHAKLNGKLYQNLIADLTMRDDIFTEQYKQKVLNHATQLPGAKGNSITSKNAQLMIFVDKKQKAHWAFLVTLVANSAQPRTLTYLLDAESFNSYFASNKIQQIEDTNMNANQLAATSMPFEDVQAGGIGGNDKTDVLYYDGTPEHRPSLTLKRNTVSKTCYLQNEYLVVRDWNHQLDTVQFPCDSQDKDHNNLYWMPNAEKVNGAYSQVTDLFYAAQTVNDMYINWYGIPVWQRGSEYPNSTKRLVFFINDNLTSFQTAGSDIFQPPKLWFVTFDNGNDTYYPWSSSFDMTAHMVARGFSEMRSALVEYLWAADSGLLISYSDMTAKAAEFYATGKNSWTVGADVMKNKPALRYLDEPTKDCEGRKPGDNCSIDNLKDYKPTDDYDLDGVYASGIYNKAFYLIATSPNWNIRKAYDIMMQANMYYWLAPGTFKEAACGVIDATNDYKYDTDTVLKAFAAVGVDASNCNSDE